MYMSRIKRYLWLSQIGLFTCLLVCSLIMPSVVVRNGGVSNFGNHPSTVILYVLGFLLNIVFIYLVAKLILRLKEDLVYIARGLMLLSFLTLMVLISTFPRHFNFTFSDIHDYLGVVLFGYEFLISTWLIFNKRSAGALALLSVQAIGSIIGLLSILKIIHFLFIGQVTGALGFGLLLCLVFPRFIESKLISKNL
jgi:hypothetical protein